MSTNTDQYNIATIRSLLKAAFTARDLWRFCQERPEFRPVMADFGFNPALSEMIDVLLEYCRTRALFDELLAEIRIFNPRQYERYQAQLHGDGTALPPTPQIPHNLPPRSEFLGREAEKTRIHEALHSRYFLISIDGIGGIGKTSLALEVAYECLHASQSADPPGIVTFDSFVWATAKDRELTLNVLLDAVALTLDYPGIVQRSLEQKRIGVEKLLRQKPCLLVVDNFETVTDDELQAFLRYLPEPSKALITTRKQKLSHVWAISLQGLEDAEALALIRGEGQRLGLTSILEADDQTLRHLQKATGGVPLALKWSVGQIKQRGQSLDSTLAALHEARGSIFEDIFARSWSLLPPNARQVLMVMPAFAAAASREGIEAASNVHHYDLDEALGQLTEMSLVEANGKLELDRQCYNIHPLTRSFARARLDEQQSLEHESRLRLAAYYVDKCREFGQWGRTDHFPWYKRDIDNILAILKWAYGTQQWSMVTSIFEHTYYFLGTLGYWQERIEYGQMALRAAQKASDPLTAAKFEHSLGWVLSRQGQYSQAKQLLSQCIQSCINLGERAEAVRAMVTLAKAALTKDDLVLARNTIDRAKKLVENREDWYAPQGLFAAEGRLELRVGNLDNAYGLLLRALEVSRETGMEAHIASRQADLGHVNLMQDRLDESAKLFEAALASSIASERQDSMAKAEYGLARVKEKQGDESAAARLATSAHARFRRMGMEFDADEVDAFLKQLETGEDNG